MGFPGGPVSICSMNRRRISSLSLVLLALGGLLAGHAASYFVVAPDAHDRAELLARTGHSAHGDFATLAMAATFAAVIGLVSSCVRARCRPRRSTLSRARVAGLLWVLQTAGFVALETWERGHGLGGAVELVTEPAFLVGLIAQALAALAATAIVLLVRATVAALLRLFVVPHGAAQPLASRSIVFRRPRSSISRAAWNLRGPPSPAASRG